MLFHRLNWFSIQQYFDVESRRNAPLHLHVNKDWNEEGVCHSYEVIHEYPYSHLKVVKNMSVDEFIWWYENASAASAEWTVGMGGGYSGNCKMEIDFGFWVCDVPSPVNIRVNVLELIEKLHA